MLAKTLCLAALTVAIAPVLAQENGRRAASAVDPITAIVEALRTHAVVALAEGDHGNEQGHALRVALIRDPRFAAAAGDVVVEFGNARYQDVIDRFVAGLDVPYADLTQVWRNTSQVGPVWDVPIYEEFFGAVRDVNRRLPADRRIRVLLGDPPIDWDRVARFADLFGQMREVGDRDGHPAKLIEREVLAKGRRALLVYGGAHFARTPPALRPGCQPGSTIPCFLGSIVDQLESATGTRVFTIETLTGVDVEALQPEVEKWPIPSLASLRDTTLGAVSYRAFFPPGPLMIGPDGQPQTASPAMARPIEDVFDAVLYLGPPATLTYSRVSPALCADAAYVQMRRRRMAMTPIGEARDGPCGQ